jgi:hypothetical protein
MPGRMSGRGRRRSIRDWLGNGGGGGKPTFHLDQGDGRSRAENGHSTVSNFRCSRYQSRAFARTCQFL